MEKENNELLQQVWERVQAMGTPLTETDVRKMIAESLDALLDDKEFVRKMRFGTPQTEDKLIGSKFARWGLTLADIEFLYDLQVSLRGQRRVGGGGGFYDGPSEELTRAFEHISKACYLPVEEVRSIDKQAIDDLFPRIPLSWFSRQDQLLVKRGGWEATEAYQRALRAMDTAESGYGSQLIGAQYVGELWEAARQQSRIFALLDTFEMTAPTAYLPVEADLPEMLFVAENTAYNSSDYSTSKSGSNRVQVDAKKFVIHQVWSGEMEEDAIIPFVPFLRAQAVKSLAHYSDSVVLNGDNTNSSGNINSDDADPADTKHYLAFDGIRHVGLVDNVANQKDLAGVLTFDTLTQAPGRMVDSTYLIDWGHPTDPDDLIYACETNTGDRISQLDEVKNWRIQQARPLLNGQVAEVVGHPVIATIAIPLTDADGKYTTTSPATNDTKGEVVTFNKRGYKVGWRRRVKTEVERLPGRDQTRLIYSLRLGLGRFSPTGAAAGIESADVIFDITL